MIGNKLIKYSNKPIAITPLLKLHHVLVSEIIENGEEWFYNLISFAKLTKKHFIVNMIPDDLMNKIISEYDDFIKMEKHLTDEILGNLTQEERELLYKLRMEFKISRYSNISESDFENVTLLELLFRNYIIEKYVYNMNHLELLEKVIESLKYLLRVDDVIIDEENMALVVYGNSGELGGKVDKVIIDGELFDGICEYVLMINCEERSKVEPKPVFKDEKTRLEYEELMAEREKIEAIKRKSQKFSMFNYIYSYVVHSDGGDYDKYLNCSYYRLMDRYKILMDKEPYEHNLRMIGVADSKDLDLKHWIEKLRERSNK